MSKIKPFVLLLVIVFFILNCENPKNYQDQIGDTPFNSELDNSSFKFCDSTNVLHKRALIKYQGGEKVLEEEIIKNYNLKTNQESFSGFFIIRFAVNCNNKSGRFRMQTLDLDFKSTECSKSLKDNILNSVKELKDWKHAFYRDKEYDCYRFLTIKMVNGKIIKA